MAAADNMPDFDSMSPEELMAWMETLAKRQGANAEELTTAADSDIAEIDPNTVVIDEPGYVPYGEERSPRPATPPPSRPAAFDLPQAAPPRPIVPPPRPIVPPPPAAPQQPAAQQADTSWRQVSPPAREPEPVTAPGMGDDAMAWLESLAADQGDALFNIDLSALTDEIEHRTPARAEEPTDPMAWLKSLATQEDTPTAEVAPTPPTPPAEVSDPLADGVDAMAWLENLARRQGASAEELTTSTEMHIPVPENPVVDEPGYTPFSFDAPEPRSAFTSEPTESLELEDPSDWLGSLADAQGFDESQIIQPQPDAALDIDSIERAIAAGTVTPEQMQVYLERQTDAYVDSLDDEEIEVEAPPVPAELPDWLLEQVGPPPVGDDSQRTDHLPPLLDVISEPPPAADLPDWLSEDLPAEGELDFDSIFANRDDDLFVAPASGDFSGLTLDVDPDDPWVEAFDAEQDGEAASLESPPDWYVRNLNDPNRISAVEQYGGASGLAAANLPDETDLPAGELMPLPEWFAVAEAVETFAEPDAADMPDWLSELDTTVVPDSIPDWLVESMDEDSRRLDAVQSEPEPEPEAPAPKPVVPTTRWQDIPASAALQEARQQATSGEIAVALYAYESLVRGNNELETVVADLQSLVRQHRSNPAVFRVLGDGLMRQGKLQSALDTYREALNLL